MDFKDGAPAAIGQLLMGGVGLRYGPWLPRGGDSLLASWEVLASSSGIPDGKIYVETKNTQDSDSLGVQLTSEFLTAAPSSGAMIATGCLELVRYAYDIQGATSDWMHLRAFPPSWLRN